MFFRIIILNPQMFEIPSTIYVVNMYLFADIDGCNVAGRIGRQQICEISAVYRSFEGMKKIVLTC